VSLTETKRTVFLKIGYALSQLGPTVQALDAVILEGREIQSIQEIHRRQLRETTQRSQELARHGRSLRNRLVAGLQSAYGSTASRCWSSASIRDCRRSGNARPRKRGRKRSGWRPWRRLPRRPG
jgi:surface antigen